MKITETKYRGSLRRKHFTYTITADINICQNLYLIFGNQKDVGSSILNIGNWEN